MFDENLYLVAPRRKRTRINFILFPGSQVCIPLSKQEDLCLFQVESDSDIVFWFFGINEENGKEWSNVTHFVGRFPADISLIAVAMFASMHSWMHLKFWTTLKKGSQSRISLKQLSRSASSN